MRTSEGSAVGGALDRGGAGAEVKSSPLYTLNGVEAHENA